MISDPTWLSLLPPLLTILVAIISRHVYLSLFFGIVFGYTLLANGNLIEGLVAGIDGTVGIFSDPGDTKIIVFCVLIGSLIATLERCGGIRGFIEWIESKPWLASAKRSQWVAWLVGVIIFVESNLTILVAGTLARPLFDRFKVSREKLAYIIDSTSAPISILIPLNAWGAYCLSLLSGIGVDEPLSVFIESMLYNFYAISAVLLTALVIAFQWNIGPMKKAELRTQQGKLHWPDSTPMMGSSATDEPRENLPTPRARNMLLPLATVTVTMPFFLYITGDGNFAQGSGSTSVLWAVLTAIAVAWALLLSQRLMNVEALTKAFLDGAGALVPLVLILLLALALGDLTRLLGTGEYIASLLQSGSMPTYVLLPLAFLLTGLTAFAIGSSWGTFAIMIPITVPTALALGLNPAPFLAVVLSGGIFGDHASPISDTTVVASMASATDHIDHVKTQLPYTLVAAGVSTLAFLITGLFL